MTTNLTDKSKIKSRAPEAVSTFIKKTYDMLDDQKFVDIVDWNEEGTAIVIKKPTEFGQKVLPTYFKHNNLTSFVRQLNMYDFHKRRTQKYDHVYYHDLFQKDKRHLLAEIRRKNQDTTLASIQKAIETLESVQSGQSAEVPANTGIYENQLLKKLNKDALARIASLESKVKDLTIQNQALYNQVVHQNQKEDILVSFLASFMKKKGITLDQLPKALNNQFNLPALKTGLENQSFVKELDGLKNENDQVSESSSMPLNVGDYLNFSEGLSNSTEISPSSPLSKSYTESDKITGSNFGSMNEANFKVENTKDQEYPDMFNKKVENWSSFDDNNEKDTHNSFFGKRTFGEDNRAYEADKEDLWGLHKFVKTDSFSFPQEGNPFRTNGSNGDICDMKVKKLDSFLDFLGNTDNQNGIGIDLINLS